MCLVLDENRNFAEKIYKGWIKWVTYFTPGDLFHPTTPCSVISTVKWPLNYCNCFCFPILCIFRVSFQGSILSGIIWILVSGFQIVFVLHSFIISCPCNHCILSNPFMCIYAKTVDLYIFRFHRPRFILLIHFNIYFVFAVVITTCLWQVFLVKTNQIENKSNACTLS